MLQLDSLCIIAEIGEFEFNHRYVDLIKINIYFRIFWLLGNNKTNRTLEGLLPNYDQDGYQLNPVVNRDTFTINTVSNTEQSLLLHMYNMYKYCYQLT